MGEKELKFLRHSSVLHSSSWSSSSLAVEMTRSRRPEPHDLEHDDHSVASPNSAKNKCDAKNSQNDI